MSDTAIRIAQLQRAATLCELHRYGDASTLLRDLIATDPDDVNALVLLARAQLGDDDAQGALMFATSAIARAPDHDWAHRLASIACRRLGMPEQAHDHAEEAIRVAPHVPESYLLLAQLLLAGRADLVRARQAAVQALTLAPERADTHCLLGQIAAASGERADASAAFHRALAIDPQNAAAHNELARLHLASRSIVNPAGLAAAATGFATALGSDPTAHVSRRNLELVMRVFLSRTAYLIFLDAFIVARLTSQSSGPGARLLPLALLVVPSLFAVRFITRLSPPLRAHLRHQLRHDHGFRAAAWLQGIAVIALVAGTLAPASMRITLTGVAFLAAAAGRAIQIAHMRKHARANGVRLTGPPTRTPFLWAIALLLAFMAATLIGTSFLPANRSSPAVGFLAGIAAAAGCVATIRHIRRRSLESRLRAALRR